MGGEIGSLRAGRRADVVVWSGDPLENASAAEIVLIDGVQQPLVNHQTKLRDRYRTPAEGDLAQGLREVIATAGLALATLAFVGTHLALSHPLRLRLVRTVGEQYFAILYSAVAFVTLGWMILAYRAVDESWPLWRAPDWAWWVASGVMLVASILLVGSFFRNPAFPQPGAKARAARPASGVFAVTRHPMNMAFILWALAPHRLVGKPAQSDRRRRNPPPRPGSARSARTARSST